MTTTTPRDRWTYGGMLAVAVAAAVLSFSSLAGLAGLAGVTGTVPLPAGGRFRLAWLLPIAVDAYALTATRVWLRTAGSVRTRGYARRNAVGAIVLSVAGNAAYHALVAAGATTLADATGGWAVVVAVSAVPPVLLGLVGHLHALVSDDHRLPTAAPAGGAVTPPTPVPAGTSTRPATAPGRDRNHLTDRDGSRDQTQSRSRRPAVGRARSRSGAEARMRAHWTAERAADRTPTGAELDRIAGTTDYGRRVRRALLAEDAATSPALPAEPTTDPQPVHSAA